MACMELHSRSEEEATAPKNLVKALAVLRLISERPAGISMAEISRATGLPKPSAHRFLGALLDDGLVRLDRRTTNTICDPHELRAELRCVRERGAAYDLVENEEGIRCCGVPVLDHRGAVVAGISVAGPEFRLTRAKLEEITPLVIAAALELSRRLGYPGSIPFGS